MILRSESGVPGLGVPPERRPTPLQQSKIVAQAKPRLGAVGAVLCTPPRRAHGFTKL